MHDQLNRAIDGYKDKKSALINWFKSQLSNINRERTSVGVVGGGSESITLKTKKGSLLRRTPHSNECIPQNLKNLSNQIWFILYQEVIHNNCEDISNTDKKPIEIGKRYCGLLSSEDNKENAIEKYFLIKRQNGGKNLKVKVSNLQFASKLLNDFEVQTGGFGPGEITGTIAFVILTGLCCMNCADSHASFYYHFFFYNWCCDQCFVLVKLIFELFSD